MEVRARVRVRVGPRVKCLRGLRRAMRTATAGSHAARACLGEGEVVMVMVMVIVMV